MPKPRSDLSPLLNAAPEKSWKKEAVGTYEVGAGGSVEGAKAPPVVRDGSRWALEAGESAHLLHQSAGRVAEACLRKFCVILEGPPLTDCHCTCLMIQY